MIREQAMTDLIKALILRHQKAVHLKKVADRKAQAEFDGRWAAMEKAGICTYCYGRGMRDDPPWGIVICTECGGTGKSS
jgi:hypothetical protein